jgi:hypothetical protein
MFPIPVIRPLWQRPGAGAAPGAPVRCELAGLASQLTRMLTLEQP